MYDPWSAVSWLSPVIARRFEMLRPEAVMFEPGVIVTSANVKEPVDGLAIVPVPESSTGDVVFDRTVSPAME
jgi:hypothetical protein